MRAFVWMLGSIFSFSLLAVAGKELSGEINIYQTLFFRSIVGIVLVCSILFFQKKLSLLKTVSNLPIHSVRNSLHFIGQYCWFLGIGLLPLSTVFALEFTMPLWALLISVLFLGESFTFKKSALALLGFIGVLVIIRPGIASFEYGALVVLASALLFAVAHTSTKVLIKENPVILIMFVMCVMQALIGGVLGYSTMTMPQGLQWFWLFVVGLASFSAHFCLASAMKHTLASTVLMLDFLRMPLIAIVGFYIYDEKIDFFVFVGAGIVLLSSLLNTIEFIRKKEVAIKVASQ